MLRGQDSNQTCDMCKQKLASSKCDCSTTRFCEQCLSVHMQTHIVVLSASMPGLEELRRNVTKIQKCIEDFQDGFQALQDSMIRTRNVIIEKLQALIISLNAKIEEAVSEVEVCSPEQVDFTCEYSLPLRHYEAGNLDCFSYKLGLCEFEELLPSLLTYELCEPKVPAKFRIPVLPFVTGSALHYYDFKKQELGEAIQLRAPFRVDYGTRLLALSDDQVFVCGGYTFRPHMYRYSASYCSARNEAYVVLRTGEVRTLPLMTRGHACPGVICWDHALFVFGCAYVDENEGHRVSELLSGLSAAAWERLPDMTKMRYSFTPVAWHEAIYLCGGYTAKIDRLTDRKMEVLELKLPEKESPALAVVLRDALVVITENYCFTVSKDCTSSNGFKSETKGKMRTDLRSHTPPAVYKDEVYVLWMGRCVKYSPNLQSIRSNQ